LLSEYNTSVFTDHNISLLLVSVLSLPQDDKQECLLISSTQKIEGFHSVSPQTIVKFTICSSLACHAEQSEAPDFCNVRKIDSSKTLCAFDDKRYKRTSE
jgi:hypothetical protein